MLAIADEAVVQTEGWLTALRQALADDDERRLRTLFHRESHWRDVLALTWHIQTTNGRDAIAAVLHNHAKRAQPTSFRIPPNRAVPRTVTRAGRDTIEAIFAFDTSEGSGNGVLRLTQDADAPRAWTLLTALDELRISEVERPRGKIHSRDFRGPNWLDLRREAATYADRDPVALVVGGGQAGLSIAAQLTHLDVDTLIVDRGARIGDNWRTRYHALTLHNQTHVNHLPFMPFPPNWPTYIPKDKLAAWFEAYVESLELNYWAGTEFEGGAYDADARRWRIAIRGVDGERRTMRPRHIVMATGVSGIPNMPRIPTLSAFRGTVLHSGEYYDGQAWAGKHAMVIGTGNSGHDIAQDLYSAGANVTLVQRSPTLIVNLEPSAQLPYALYGEGLSLEDADLIATSIPLAMAKESHRRFTRRAAEVDKPLLDALERVGFKLDFGEDGTGWQFKYLTRGGGYYFNVGCSDLVADGSIGLVQFADVACFVAEGVRLRSGNMLPVDLIVLATGWRGQEHLVTRLFGSEVANRVGPIWGFGDGDELRNMFVRTPQPGLYFIAGSLAQCRIYSKYLALQIKAYEAGLFRGSEVLSEYCAGRPQAIVGR